MKAEEKNKEFTESERLSADEQKIAQMLGGLRRVEAPGDFEFRVKARIAKGAPSESGPAPLFGKFKYFAPLALAMIVAGFIGFSDLMSPRVNNETTLANAPRAASPSANDQSENFVSTAPAVVPGPAAAASVPARQDREEIASAGHNRKSNRRPSAISENTGGGSKTSTGRSVKVLINPRGMDPTPLNTSQKPSEVEGTPKTSVRELLSLLGVDAEPAANGWMVKSSKSNGAAERSGVKAGDVIEAIDDRQIDANSVFTGNFGVKSLKVLREGKSLVILLLNK